MLDKKIPYGFSCELEDYAMEFLNRKTPNTGDIMWLIKKAYQDGKEAGYIEGLRQMDDRMFS